MILNLSNNMISVMDMIVNQNNI